MVVGMLIAWALTTVCCKSSPPKQVDTNAIRVILTTVSQKCDSLLADGANAHEIQNIKTLMNTGLECLAKVKVD